MAVTIYGDRINYNGYGDQYVSMGTSLDTIGSYCTAFYYPWGNMAINDTTAGSNLRYNPSAAYSSGATAGNLSWYGTTGMTPGVSTTANTSWPGGGSSLSGTWRKMSMGNNVASTSEGYGTRYMWFPHLYQRLY